MLRVGNASIIPKELEFEWTITDFFMKWFTEPSFCSPAFYFADATWRLEIHPEEDSEDDKINSANIFLIKKSHGLPVSLKYSISLKTSDGKKYLETYFKETFQGRYSECISNFRLSAKLFSRMYEMMSVDALTVICSMKCLDFDDAKTEKILGDLKGLVDNGSYSDITILVKGQEFRLHRNILNARNAFFGSMLTNASTLSIDDYDPDVFRSFIHFLYTGEVDKMTLKNVHELYEMADKFQQNHLKEECSQFMINSMCVDNFCDFVVIALRYDDTKLLDKAIKVFAMKTKEIVFTKKWIAFLNDYTAYATELHLRAIEASQSMKSQCGK